MAFGGKSWHINGRDMNLGLASDGSPICTRAIFDWNTNPNFCDGFSWIIRGAFLKNVYSILRFESASALN